MVGADVSSKGRRSRVDSPLTDGLRSQEKYLALECGAAVSGDVGDGSIPGVFKQVAPHARTSLPRLGPDVAAGIAR